MFVRFVRFARILSYFCPILSDFCPNATKSILSYSLRESSRNHEAIHGTVAVASSSRPWILEVKRILSDFVRPLSDSCVHTSKIHLSDFVRLLSVFCPCRCLARRPAGGRPGRYRRDWGPRHRGSRRRGRPPRATGNAAWTCLM